MEKQINQNQIKHFNLVWFTLILVIKYFDLVIKGEPSEYFGSTFVFGENTNSSIVLENSTTPTYGENLGTWERENIPFFLKDKINS